MVDFRKPGHIWRQQNLVRCAFIKNLSGFILKTILHAWFQGLEFFLTTMHGTSRSGDPDYHTMAVNRTE